ncbi:FtsX-like permease family protein [Balneolaceae bacterium YR4-1]|uniref:FtsX-like permease family protein n=1 Tax=Halalkalibaculum roseum TaxID=2709311 RepID=A0A6M1SXA5_9BACT|nr:ABC transporter permease [Halalkalibaculum roseum]NGP77670.1 FtsX-like permease family protein [Halalkalibaculum roseum]
MVRNYLKIAFRNLVKRKAYTFINIFGLAIGLACCLLISMYVLNELSYDRFHEKADQIYRIKQTSLNTDETSATTTFKTGPMLEAEYPQLVEHSVRFFNMQQPTHTMLDRETGNSFRESNFYFTDSTFFEVFDGKLIRGNPEQVLDNPLSLVMTEERARVYFGDENPIGKTLSFQGRGSMSLEVTGIMESWPEKSHMKFDMLASFSSVDVLYRRSPEYDESWWWNPVWTYVELKNAGSAGELDDQLEAFADKYYNPNRPEGEEVSLGLQALTDIHLYSNLEQEMNPNNSIFYIYLFSAVAVLILVIACVNFMNLATARSAERGREVGMRKVLGADRRQLFSQFMGESFLMSFLAVVLAVVLVYFTLPIFNDFISKNLAFNIFDNAFLIGGLLFLYFAVGFLAGIYPAFYLSAFNPSVVLKGEADKGSRSVLFRKGLVVFQFSLSVILIISTVLLYMQLQHMQSKKLGFDKEQVVILPMEQNLIAWEFDQFREQAMSDPNVRTVTATSKILGTDDQQTWKIYPATTPDEGEKSSLALHVTYNFLEAYDINLIAGRTFSRYYPTDKKQAILINEEMVKRLGFEEPEDAIGELFYHELSEEEVKTLTVIGVTENFNYTSVKKEIKPLVIRLSEGTRPILQTISNAVVKLGPGGVNEGLKHLEEVWAEVNHIDPFQYSFQDEELDKIYAAEMTLGRVTGVFTLLCILVACLGLFGLASFTASKRTKEIGIRKTLGASLSQILVLLSKEYVQLVLIANIIAWPVVYFLARGWLQDFPYRINLGLNLIGVFAATILLSVIICLVTVSYKSLKAALINPVDSIKQE